ARRGKAPRGTIGPFFSLGGGGSEILSADAILSVVFLSLAFLSAGFLSLVFLSAGFLSEDFLSPPFLSVAETLLSVDFLSPVSIMRLSLEDLSPGTTATLFLSFSALKRSAR